MKEGSGFDGRISSSGSLALWRFHALALEEAGTGLAGWLAGQEGASILPIS